MAKLSVTRWKSFSFSFSRSSVLRTLEYLCWKLVRVNVGFTVVSHFMFTSSSMSGWSQESFLSHFWTYVSQTSSSIHDKTLQTRQCALRVRASIFCDCSIFDIQKVSQNNAYLCPAFPRQTAVRTFTTSSVVNGRLIVFRTEPINISPFFTRKTCSARFGVVGLTEYHTLFLFREFSYTRTASDPQTEVQKWWLGNEPPACKASLQNTTQNLAFPHTFINLLNQITRRHGTTSH